MFGQIPEIMNSEVRYKGDNFRHQADQERLARQAKGTQQDKRVKQWEVLQAVKMGRLSIEEGLKRLENV
jgi:ABC-type cobalamin/Fe3+-siderophores transport system ATPase subunit